MFILLALLCSAQSGDRTLNLEVTLKTEELSKASLLDTLEQIYGLHFSYNPILLEAEKPVKVDANRKPLYVILNALINPEVLGFKAFDNQVVFFPVQDEAEPISIPENIIIRGAVAEGRKGEPIPYCNIAIVSKALGTMTNQNGRFILKVPKTLMNDTLVFSSLGFESFILPIASYDGTELAIELSKKTYNLRSVDVIRYDPAFLLFKVDENIPLNYDNEYSLFSTFYRELTMENNEYIDISEAVLQVMKAPYTNETREDHVKFIKGRKGADARPLNDIKFRLQGGPYYITKLDVVKNNESFINPELRHLYTYNFDQLTSIDERQTAVVTFKPIYNLRDVLFEGKLYIDIETWAIARIEFQYTRQGLRMARNTLILKEPKRHRAIPTDLSYVIQYKYLNNKWYLLTARSKFNITINNKEKRERTKFYSVAELLTTNIEKGDFQHFSRKEIFKSNEIFTDKIVSYDRTFWESYNVIRPEEELEKALKNFDDQNLIIIYRN